MLRQFVKENQADKKGLMLQVSTGEGKSNIIALLATVWSLAERFSCGNKPFIGVITSNRILAKRDAEEWEPFFELFRLTTNHMGHDVADEISEAYTCDITYGYLHDFLSHSVCDEFHGQVQQCFNC